MNTPLLVIDDEPDMRALLEVALTGAGFAVTTAGDGARALELAQEQPFELVLTDLKMPGVDGVEVLAGLKRIDPDLVVVVATGYASLETAIACLRGGAFDYLQKPYLLSSLIGVLRRAQEERRRRVALKEAGRALALARGPNEIVEAVRRFGERALDADAIALQPTRATAPEVRAVREADAALAESLLPLATAAGEAQEPSRLASDTPGPLADRPGASALAYPLVARQDRVGTLVFLRRNGRDPFTPADLLRGEPLAPLVALALCAY
jgi:CheY-like chemotaxis protein